MCSTYSTRTCSGPRTNTAYVFGGVDDIVDLDAEVVRAGDVLVRRLDEHREVVEQRPLGRARLAGMELDERAADLDTRRA